MRSRIVFLLGLMFLGSGCQMSYLYKSAKGQWGLLRSRIPLQEALEDPRLGPTEKAKLHLAQEARSFGETELGLSPTKNYTQFVQLDRPYVTYVVSAAPAWELKAYEWSFPIVGKVPYKGYFQEVDAKEEEKNLREQGLDTYLRGVSAYSTLGWFQDPILSSMLRYKDQDLVNLILHESVHATLFIKSSADFNERLATFIGNQGTEAFFLHKEGADSPTLKKIRDDNADEKLFAAFMSREIKALEDWYKSQPTQDEKMKKERLQEIQKRFVKEIKPQLRSESYARFPDLELNNARLLVYKTYLGDLHDFERVFEKMGRDFKAFLRLAKQLEKEKDPAKKLKEWGELSGDQLHRIAQAQ